MSDAIAAPPAPAQSPADPTPASTFPHFGGLELLIPLAFAVYQSAGVRGMVSDPGIGWHVRTIDWIIQHGTWPTADPFTGPRQGTWWLANQWLADVFFWLGWQLAGLNGITAIATILCVLMFRLVYGFMRSDGIPWSWACIFTLIAALGSAYSWVARPNLLTMLFILITARALILTHEGRLGQKRWWIVGMFCLWANCHGGFVAGLAMLGLGIAVELCVALFADDATTKAAGKRAAVQLLQIAPLCLLATLINPYGWTVYPWIFSLLGDDYFMRLNTEWLAPRFHDPGMWRLELIILLIPALFALSARRLHLIELALTLSWLYLALNGWRYSPILGLVVAPILVRQAVQLPWLVRRWQALPLSAGFRAMVDTPRPTGWRGFTLVAVGTLVIAAVTGPTAKIQEKMIPTTALNHMLAEWQPDEVIFHGPNWGGYLTWQKWPELLVWSDDRNEVQGRAHLEHYFKIAGTEPGWEQLLAETRASWVAMPPKTALAYRLAERPAEWQERYRDEHGVVFRRISTSNPPTTQPLPEAQ